MAEGHGIAGRAARRESAVRPGGALLLVGILLLAANLRPALTSVAPLVGEIRAETGVSNGVAGLLTTLPLLAFGALSPAAPLLARRFGLGRTLLFGLLILAVGILVRSSGSVLALFLGTVALGGAISLGNVLLPALVKREFPGRAGPTTSLYTTALGLSAAFAAGVSFPVARWGLEWRGALAVWAVPALLAAVAWAFVLRRKGASRGTTEPPRDVRGLWRSPLAWQVTMFMGLQSLAYYTTLTWLPAILREDGMSAATAGLMLALSQAIAIPAMFLAPMLAGRRPSQRLPLATAAILCAVGTAGLMVGGSTAIFALWVVLLGLGQGACFSLALTLFAVRAPDPTYAAALSGMAQTVGYLLSAGGPFLFGVLRDATGAWDTPLVLLLVIAGAILAAGLGAGRDALVAAPEPPSGPTT